MQPYFTQMAKATGTRLGPQRRAARTWRPAHGHRPLAVEVHVDVSRFIDVDAERKRLEKQRDELAKFAKSIARQARQRRLRRRAPAEVVAATERDKLADSQAQLASAEAALKKLG